MVSLHVWLDALLCHIGYLHRYLRQDLNELEGKKLEHSSAPIELQQLLRSMDFDIVGVIIIDADTL